MELLAYVAERAIISVIDIVIGGLAGYLIARGGKARIWGIALLALYLLAAIGAILGEGLSISVAFGVAAFALALIVGIATRRR